MLDLEQYLTRWPLLLGADLMPPPPAGPAAAAAPVELCHGDRCVSSAPSRRDASAWESESVMSDRRASTALPGDPAPARAPSPAAGSSSASTTLSWLVDFWAPTMNRSTVALPGPAAISQTETERSLNLCCSKRRRRWLLCWDILSSWLLRVGDWATLCSLLILINCTLFSRGQSR